MIPSKHHHSKLKNNLKYEKVSPLKTIQEIIHLLGIVIVYTIDEIHLVLVLYHLPSYRYKNYIKREIYKYIRLERVTRTFEEIKSLNSLISG